MQGIYQVSIFIGNSIIKNSFNKKNTYLFISNRAIDLESKRKILRKRKNRKLIP